MRDRFKFYTDPAHGWLAVKREELKDLGIERGISSCSYQKGDTVYLEEDCDAELFCREYEKKYKRRMYFDERATNNRHWIRSCQIYVVTYQ